MRTSTVRAKWKMSQPVLAIALYLRDPLVAEMVSMLGFDCLWLDMEHHPRSVETLDTMMRAARVGVADILARPAKGELMRMGRMLEGGAMGVMYPRCDGPEEAEAVVNAMKFPPMGQRGLDGAGPDSDFYSHKLSDYLAHANRETFLMIQVEDAAALDQVEKTAAVKGVDGIFFGPGDFSVSAGVPGEVDHPTVRDAIRRVARAAKAAGKRWGMPAIDPAHAKEFLELGASMLAYGTDTMVLKAAYENMQREFAPIGFSFANRLNQSDSGHV